MDLDIDRLRQWIGQSERRADLIASMQVQGLAALLDRDDAEPRIGDALPPCWHWLYALAPMVRSSMLGRDGHPQRGGFLPPGPLRRRMWAGSRLRFFRPLKVGDTLHRRSTIDDVSVKHDLQDVVFRDDRKCQTK